MIPGCTDPIASNYNAEATLNNGSCEYLGCTDEAACNFDADALTDDGSCDFPADLYGSAEYDCEGNCLSDVDGDGICDGLEVAGCTDLGPALTAPPTTTVLYLTCAGCSDAEADNYNPDALIVDDSLCQYLGVRTEADNYDMGPTPTMATAPTSDHPGGQLRRPEHRGQLCLPRLHQRECRQL